MSVREPQPEHYSVALEPDDDQWYRGRCSCGYDAGMFPTAEDACDALMEHAYDAGRASNGQPDRAKGWPARSSLPAANDDPERWG